MEAYTCCQSCGTPIDRPELMGTEKDGSKSTIYCKFCYRNGEFADPDITLEAMKTHVKEELIKAHTPEPVIGEAIAKVRHLGRWLGGSSSAAVPRSKSNFR
jgi:hypothetical protein